MSGVLDGIRIVDLCRAPPGRMATSILADYGADAISVLDPTLVLPNSQQETSPHQDWHPSLLFVTQLNHRNKRSMLLNLKATEGKKVLYQLVRTTDGLLESNRPGVVERLGFDYATLSRINPRLVYVALSGYGQYGPYTNRPAHDLSYQATGGMLVKDSSGQILVPPYSQADINAATNGTLALLMGLVNAQRTGQGEYIDVAFGDSAIAALPGGPIMPGGGPDVTLRGAYPCYNIYETKDGKHLTLSTLEPWFWQRLCQLFGREEWLDHQRPEGTLRDEMFAFFRQQFRSRTLAEWLKILGEADIQFGPVNETVDDVVNDPHHQVRESVIEARDPISGKSIAQIGFIMKFASHPATLRFGPNLLGAETVDILRELGYNERDIRRLEQAGVIALP